MNNQNRERFELDLSEIIKYPTINALITTNEFIYIYI